MISARPRYLRSDLSTGMANHYNAAMKPITPLVLCAAFLLPSCAITHRDIIQSDHPFGMIEAGIDLEASKASLIEGIRLQSAAIYLWHEWALNRLVGEWVLVSKCRKK